MKIGIIIIANEFSGAERVVYNLAEALSTEKLKIHLIVNEEILKYYNKLKIKGVRIHNIGKCTGGNLITNRFLMIKPKKVLKKIIKKEKFDLIKTNMIISPEFYKLIFKFKIPHLLVFHGTEIKDFIESKGILYNLLYKPVFSSVFLKSNLLISVGKQQIQNLSEKYKKRTIVIPNGVDSKVFKPIKKIKQKKNVILFTGRFIERKGFLELINTTKQLPKYEFWFAGEGPLSNLINLPNTKNLGFKTTGELVKLYNQATICVFPSHWEALPLCGLEAMSCGRAVIVTPLGFSEYIENGKDGIIIPAKDENALKNAILDLMTNEKKRKILEKNARKKALQYSWYEIAKQYLKVFKEVVKAQK
jgi:glycosyltransferase involved in cell wall biosynthesis